MKFTSSVIFPESFGRITFLLLKAFSSSVKRLSIITAVHNDWLRTNSAPFSLVLCNFRRHISLLQKRVHIFIVLPFCVKRHHGYLSICTSVFCNLNVFFCWELHILFSYSGWLTLSRFSSLRSLGRHVVLSSCLSSLHLILLRLPPPMIESPA